MPATKKSNDHELAQSTLAIAQSSVHFAQVLRIVGDWAASIDPSTGRTVDERLRMQDTAARYVAIAMLTNDLLLASLKNLRDQYEGLHPGVFDSYEEESSAVQADPE